MPRGPPLQVLIILIILLSYTLSKTTLFDVSRCFYINEVDFRMIDAAFISGSINGAMDPTLICTYNFILSNSKAFRFPWIFVKNLSLEPFNEVNDYAILTFKTEMKVLFKIILNQHTHQLANVILTKTISANNVNWTKDISLEIKFQSKGNLHVAIMMVTVYHCSSIFRAVELFDCKMKYDDVNICIGEGLLCDQHINCILNGKDESKENCYSNLYIYIIVFIVSFFIFLAFSTWLIFKLLPCLLSRQGFVRPNLDDLRYWITRRRELQGVESITTPDLLTSCPPLYQKDKIEVEHCLALPPSYSDGTQVAVEPDFLKHFFGNESGQRIYTPSNLNMQASILSNATVINVNDHTVTIGPREETL